MTESDFRGPARPATLVLFTVMVAHALLETARDALFLAKLGPDRLALAYLAIAGIAIVALFAMRRWLGIRDPRRLLVGFLVFATSGTALLSATIAFAPWVVFVLYIWTGLVATLVVPCFWTLVDKSFSVEQAKRVFATIGAGGVLGAMIGSAVAAALGRLFPPHHLVTAGAVGFGIATFAAITVAPRPLERSRRKRARPEVTTSERSVKYVRLLLAIGVISTVTLTLGDLVFKRRIAEWLAPEDLAAVLGSIYTALNLLGLAVQLVIAPRLLARFGVGASLLMLPILVVTSSLGFALTGAVVSVLVLKLGDGSMRHSLHRVASEILYLPVPPRVRDGAKPIADALGHRGGQALAALVVLAMMSIDGRARVLAMIAAGAGLVWIGCVVFARRWYVDQFREMLRTGETEREARVLELDSHSMDLLVESLSSPDEVEALAALELLGRHPEKLPALVLYHPRKRVVCRALGLLAGRLRSDVARVLDYLLEHPDPEIRSEALAASSRTGQHHARLLAALEDEHSIVRATALVGLHGDPEVGDRVVVDLAAMQGGTAADRLALARAISYAPHERWRTLLAALLDDDNVEVVREVLRVYEREPHLAHLPKLIRLLEDTHLRGDARRVLVALGPAGLEILAAALVDPRTPLAIRRHLPRTISRFASAPAADALVQRLLHEPDGTTEFKLLRALGRMRSDHPTLPVHTTALRNYARRTVARAARYATLLDSFAAEGETSRGALLLVELLGEKRHNAIEHAFRAFGILYPTAQLRSVHTAIAGNDEVRRGAAREIFDEFIPAELRGPLLAVIEDLPPESRRERLGSLAAGPFRTYEDLLVELLSDPSESIRCVVAYDIAERQLVSLRPQLQRLRPLAGSDLVIHAFDQALSRLHV